MRFRNKTKKELQALVMQLEQENMLLRWKKVREKRPPIYRTKSCWNCSGVITLRQHRCPHCHTWVTKDQENQYLATIPVKRNEEIITKLKTGNYTLVQLGKEYGISRERIRQIYKRATGERFRVGIIKRAEIREQQKSDRLQTIKMNCAGCQKPVTYQEGRGKKMYCIVCNDLRMNKNRDMKVKKICRNCNKTFSPYSNTNSPSQRIRGFFCNNLCYFDTIHQAKLLREYYLGISLDL